MAAGAVINPTNAAAVPATSNIPGVASGAVNNAAAPVAAVPNVTSPMATTQANPYAAPAATASTSGVGTVPGAISPYAATGDQTLTQSNGINTTGTQGTSASNSLQGDFQATYGQGTGNAITDLLSNMGSTDSGAIQATIANTDLAAGQQYSNIQAGEAASGVTANSSTAALAGSQFYTGVNAQLQQTIGSEEESEQTQELQTLLDEGTAHGASGSTLDSVMGGATDALEIGGAVAGAVVGI